MKSAVSLAREFTKTGMKRPVAEAIAEAIVTHSDDPHATKADFSRLEKNFAELRGEFKTQTIQMKTMITLMVGLYVGFAILFLGDGGG